MKIHLANTLNLTANNIPLEKLSLRASEKFLRLKENSPKSAVNCAIGDLLLKHELNSRGIVAPQILQNENGKPYFEGQPFEFNISHQQNLVVLAVSDTPVGIDVQTLDDDKLKMATVLLNELELSEFNALENSEAQIKYLIKCFTQKEAYVKMLGEALPYPPSSIKSYEGAKFVTKYVFQDNKVYCLTVCSHEIKSLTFKVHNVFQLVRE